MTSFVNGKVIRRRYPKIVLAMGLVFIALIVAMFIAVRNYYDNNLKPVDSGNDTALVVAIAPGSSIDDITKQLKSNNLIRAEWAFKRYTALHNYSNSLQAGTYKFKPSQDTPAIVADLINGKVEVELFTIFPAHRLDQIRQSFIRPDIRSPLLHLIFGLPGLGLSKYFKPHCFDVGAQCHCLCFSHFFKLENLLTLGTLKSCVS